MEEKSGTIYGLSCACHPERGIRYVGKTAGEMRLRFASHKSKARRGGMLPVMKWIRKHGEDRICVSVLELAAPGVALDNRERFWIAHYRATGQADLNIKDGGGPGPSGYRHSPETRKKMSDAAGARVGDKSSNWGRIFPDEWRENISKSHTHKRCNFKMSPESARRAVEMLKEGFSQRAVATVLGVSRPAIGLIKRGKTWRSVISAEDFEIMSRIHRPTMNTEQSLREMRSRGLTPPESLG